MNNRKNRTTLSLLLLFALLAPLVGLLIWWIGPWSATFRYAHMDLVSLRRMLDDSPQNALGWRILGLRLAREGDGNLATPALLQALSLRPNDSEVATGLGEIYTANGRYPEAFQVLKLATTQQPPNPLAFVALGRLYRKKASYLHAAEAFETVVKLNPGLTDAWYELAICYLQMQRAARAADAIDKALQQAPDQPEYLALKGSIDVASGKLDEGFAAAQRASQLAPTNLKIQSNYVNMLLANHRNEQDLEQAEQIIGLIEQIDARNPLLPFQHGELERLRGHWPQALNYLERATQSSPQQDEVYFALSQVYRRLKRTSKADKLQRIYRRRQSIHQKIDEVRIQLEGNPNDPSRYAQLAEIQLQLGDIQGAIASLKSGLEIDPQRTDLKRRLASLEQNRLYGDRQ